MIELTFVDDYERALARLSELADEALSAQKAHPESVAMIAYAYGMKQAFEALARIRPRIPRTPQSDLREDR